MSDDILDLNQAKIQELQLKQQKLSIMKNLPHRYGMKHYAWSRKFFESTNRMNLLVAANQIGKSSVQIRKAIEWATNSELWPKLWRKRPRLFWYLYPSNAVTTVEVEKKWIPDFLPRNEFKDHPQYGWRLEKTGKDITALHFLSGVSIYFKTYAQSVHTLQTGTIDAVFCDEELPEDILPEIQARLFATDGFFHLVFTATLNQILWWRAMHGRGDEEVFPDAFKQTVSMYDCQFYEDGSPGPWDLARIQQKERECKSDAERRRRILGHFVKDEGLRYPNFDASQHFIKPFRIPEDHIVYAAVDIGGGGDGHPAAITFIAVQPDFRKGYLFKAWRGDHVQTTSGDILEKYRDMKRGLKVVSAVYDWQAKDFGTIAQRMGENFQKANKSHDIGEDVLNNLFKTNTLLVFDDDEPRKLGTELMNLSHKSYKTVAKDDLIDSTRYNCVQIPWDWEWINRLPEGMAEKPVEVKPLTEAEYIAREIDERRAAFIDPTKPAEGWDGLDAEFNYWNDEYGN